MASCEKCWDDAGRRTMINPTKDKTEHYHDILEERRLTPCTPEEQAGKNASFCPHCERDTIHQYARFCVICNFKPQSND